MPAAVSEVLKFSINTNATAAINSLKSYSAELASATKALQSFKGVAQGKSLGFESLGNQVQKLAKKNAALITANERLVKSYQTLKNTVPSVNTGLKSQTTAMQSAAKAGGSYNKSLLNTAAVIGVAYTAVKTFSNQVKTGFNFTANIENANRAFQVMTGSVEQANSIMSDLFALQKRSTMGVSDAATATKQMMAYGFSAQEVTKQMEMLAKVGGAVNVTLSDMAYVYGTLKAQGRAYTRDITQFAQRGIPIWEYLAKTMNTTTSQMKGLVEAGKVGFPEVEVAMKAMVDSGGVFFGLMESQMDTLSGRFNLLGKSWEIAMGDLVSKMSPALKTLADALRSVIEDNPELFTKLGESLGQLVRNITPLITKALPTLLKLFTSLVDIFNLVSPLLITIIGGFIDLIGALNMPVAGGLLVLLVASTWTRVIPGVNLVTKAVTSLGGALLTVVSRFASLKSLSLAGAMNFNLSGVGQASSAMGGGLGGIATVLGPLAAAAAIVAASFSTLDASLRKTNETLQAEARSGKQGAVINAIGYNNMVSKFSGNDIGSQITRSMITMLGVESKYVGKIDSPFAEIKKQSEDLKLPVETVASALADAGAISRQAAADFIYFTNNAAATREEVNRLARDVLPKLTTFFGKTWSASLNSMPNYVDRDATKGVNNREKFQLATGMNNGLIKNYTADNGASYLSGTASAQSFIKDLSDEVGDILSPTNAKSMIQNIADKMKANGVDEETIKTTTEGYWSDYLKDWNGAINQSLESVMTYLQTSGTKDPELSAALTSYAAYLSSQLIPDTKTGGKAKELGTWWTPLELAAQKTTSELDDMNLSYQKSLESLTSEYDERFKNLKALGATGDELNALTATFKQASLDLSTASAQEIATYNLETQARSNVAQGVIRNASTMEQLAIAHQNNLAALELQRKQLIANAAGLAATDPKMAAFRASLDELTASIKTAQKELGASIYSNAVSGSSFFQDRIDRNNTQIGANADMVAGLKNSNAPQAVKDSLTNSAASSDMAAMLDNVMSEALSGMDIGALIGGNPIVAFIASLVEAVMALESFQKILNPIGTLVSSIFDVIGPMLDGVVKPFVDILEDLGKIIGAVLAPFVNMLGLQFRLLAGLIKVVVFPPLVVLGNAFAWLNDEVIVPIGNAMISIVNKVIDSINSALGFMGVHITRLDKLLKVSESDAEAALLEESATALAATISYLESKLSETVSGLISSAQDLYDVGAITASEYQDQVDQANAYLNEDASVLYAAKSAESLAEIYDALTYAYAAQELNSAGIELSIAQLNSDLSSVIKASDSTTALGQVNTTLESLLEEYQDTYDVDLSSYLDRIVDLLNSLNGTSTGSSSTSTTSIDMQGLVDSLGSSSSSSSSISLLSIVKSITKARIEDMIADGVITSSEKSTLESMRSDIANASWLWDSKSSEAYIDVINALIDSASSYAVGTSYVPQDMLANIHQGEIINTASDSDAIRRGEVALVGSGYGTSSSQIVYNINIEVAGSVTAEEDLAVTITETIANMRSRGNLVAS